MDSYNEEKRNIDKPHCQPPKHDLTLPELFLWAVRHNWGEGSDMHQWCPALYAFGSFCDHITDMGVDAGVSTGALLATKPKTMHSYDIKRLPCVDAFEAISKANGIDYTFHHKSVLEVEIEETDLLLIDTLHTYDQIKAELTMHADKVRKWIFFHDTNAFPYNGETPGSVGIVPAINEFIAQGKFRPLLHYPFNCGLTILERV